MNSYTEINDLTEVTSTISSDKYAWQFNPDGSVEVIPIKDMAIEEIKKQPFFR